MPASILRPRVACAAVASVLLPFALPAAPQHVLVLGDSLSEEYAFELPFSAPDSAPFAANLRNWVELLAATRPAEVSFGSYDGHLAAYPDYRDGGHAFNWAVPGFKTTDLVELINPSLFPRDELELLDALSYPKLRSQLKNDVAWVVIFCGGNDLSSLYAELAAGTATPAQLAAIRDNLAATIDFVRAQNAALRIVLVNAPDIGVTPAVQARGATPEARAVATVGIASLNTMLAALAADRGIALADSFALTRRAAEAAPFRLNGTVFLPTAHPENDPHYLFAKDGFHAATVLQALIANEILRAMNARYGAGFTPLSGPEILVTLGLDPDQPLRDWLAAAALPADTAPTADPDTDGLPLLTEFALGLSPTQPDAAPLRAIPPTDPDSVARFEYPLDHSGGYALTSVEWTADLAGPWQPVPTEWISAGSTANEVTLPAAAGPRVFLRLRSTLAP